MENVGIAGLGKAAEQGIAFAILVSVIIGLVWFIRYLLKELKEARLDMQAIMKETNEIIKNNTVSFVRLEDAVRHLTK